ncbi:MAG TPA: maleylpyruvate isomerase family mycothiol-dependent enzyme [Streptosporangiaceae bacterium]
MEPVQGDPVALRERVADAHRRVLATATRITDIEVAGPSLLPGWSRGHVLTHIARNADGLRNLLIWARTGIETPQYASLQARDQEISAGAGRTAAELAADISDSGEAFGREAGTLDATAWQASVRGLRGPAHPAWVVLRRRLSELEIHHVDLNAGYRPDDWPESFVDEFLQNVTSAFDADESAEPAELTNISTGQSYRIGTAARASAGPRCLVSGPGGPLLAWLLGRSDGAGLTAGPGGRLPAVPAW